MAAVIDYESIVKGINDQSKDLLKKYDIDKRIPFTISYEEVTMEMFLSQFDGFIQKIVNEIISQLSAQQTSLMRIQKEKELLCAYTSFTQKNGEVYRMLLSSLKEKDELLLQLNSSITLNENQSNLKSCSLEEMNLLNELNRLKKKKQQLIDDRKEESLKAHIREKKVKKLQLILIAIIVVLLLWIISH